MARPAVFSTDTTLYHPAEGAKVFPKGEQDPGPMWTEQRGGVPVGKDSTAGALKDLIAAQDRIESLEAQLVTQDHSLAQIGKERDAAVGKLGDMEQAKIAAEKARDDAEKVAADLTVERDAARAETAGLRAKIAAFDGDGDGEPGGAASSPEKDELIAQLTELKADFDGRWGVSKLRKALDAATAPKA